MDPIPQIPIHAIHADALPRDRATLDPQALDDLVTSIATNGLRQPIEVWPLSTPTPEGHTHGLISGFRRLTAHHRLATLRGNGDFTTIAAFL
ncbi:MAG: ParB N-terminal domain-containing protein, partial [Paracoccaceae bacterium]